MDKFKVVGSYRDKQNYVCLVQIPIALSPSPASLPEKSASEPRRLSRVGCRCAGTFLRVHRSTEVAAFRSRSTGSAEEDTELFAPVSLRCPRSEDEACVRWAELSETDAVCAAVV